jgi:nucleoid-associated protein YgaU
MSIFSFLKDVGDKLFGGGKAPAAQASAPMDEEMAKALAARVQDLGLKVEDLSISFSGHKATVKGRVSNQAEREKVVLAIGNSEGVAEVDDQLAVPQAEPQAKFYTVVKGDTLSKISQQFYKDANQYMKIFEANKPMLAHPDKIYPGQVLRIP